jgi:hypothetical protein
MGCERGPTLDEVITKIGVTLYLLGAMQRHSHEDEEIICDLQYTIEKVQVESMNSEITQN